MSDTPIQAVLRALDGLDLEGAVELFAPDALLTMVFGERAEGREQVRAVLGTFLQGLRAMHHEATSVWNPEAGVWVARTSATYELTDFSQRGPYERAIIARGGDSVIDEFRIYGQHELPMVESGSAYTDVRGAHGWLPTL